MHAVIRLLRPSAQLLDAAVAGDLAAQRTLFRKIEPLARGRGQGAVIDGWADDVDWLRDG
jgi:hypothetical protein